MAGGGKFYRKYFIHIFAVRFVSGQQHSCHN